ncbi:MAG: hypothetical protein IT363_13500 [Methanoregulaceae archaeon]|nr:hypothetical protein [Methanoregulaceae archaeon]
MKPIAPPVLLLFGVLALAAGFAISRQGLPPRIDQGWIISRPVAFSGLSAPLYTALGLAALYHGVVGVQPPKESARARQALTWLVSLSLLQAVLTLAALLLGALMLGIAGVGPALIAVIGLAPLVQVLLTGFALYRLATGWPWVRLFLASGIAASVVFGLSLLAMTEGTLRARPVEEDTSFPVLQVLAATHLLPLGLAIWLTRHGTTDEYGGEVGLVDDLE